MNPGQLLSITDLFSVSGDAALLCAVIMPDHVHWIFQLGVRLSLSQVVAKWKVVTAATLTGSGMAWQSNFFEHRLRPDEDVESYGFYVFMNPYVAGLPENGTPWPWWRKGVGVTFRFEAGLIERALPPPEWIDHADAQGGGMSVGE